MGPLVPENDKQILVHRHRRGGKERTGTACCSSQAAEGGS